jgi:hypothetical protein
MHVHHIHYLDVMSRDKKGKVVQRNKQVIRICDRCHDAITAINEMMGNQYREIFGDYPQRKREIAEARTFLFQEFMRTRPESDPFIRISATKNWVRITLSELQKLQLVA